MILCIGLTPALQRTVILDRLELNAVNRAVEVREGASGKSINVARVLRALGCDTLAGGFLGGDTGRRLRADLSAAGIRHDFVTVKAPTRICTTLVDRSRATATELVEEAAGVSVEDCGAVLAKLMSSLNQAKLLVLSGSLPPGAPADFYAQCTKPARAAGVRAILDARGVPLQEALHERPFVVKLNQQELAATLEMTLEDESDLIEAMQTPLQRGAQWIIVTRGAQGALLGDGRRFYRLHVPAIRAVNAIGSGDAFAAGLAAELSDGRDVPQACRLGAACAVANALTDQAGHVETSALPAILNEVRIEDL